MFLKSLTLKGFKSFADPCTLVLEPGVTVVVGPNGSGKSNVVDAVAWVLGAQGPRTVRSSKMEDVIFAGSADRPALGRAEVSLTIDNRAGRLPGGLAEITITRTLFRSGDSEYALNGQPCRLLDIQELLSDSGVGRQQHVIVSQGQLGTILDSRPEDRRAVIEEAAGVLKHRRRRERAERRLAATEENLDRLGDLLREVRRQMRPLERQAAAARSHASLSAELLALRLYLVGRDLSSFDLRRAEASGERDRLTAQEQGLTAALEEIDTAADAAAAELASRREEDLVASLTRVQGLVERCRGLAGVVAERRRSIMQALEASADVDVVSTLEADAARLSSELQHTGQREATLSPQADEVRRAEQDLAQDLASHRATYSDLGALRGAEGVYALARGELETMQGSLERDHDGLARAEQRVSAAEGRRDALVHESSDLADQLEAAGAEVEELRREHDRAQAEADRALADVSGAEEELRRVERHHHRLEARAEALANRATEERGAVEADVSDLAGVMGTLEELVDVDEGWRVAFEAAVGAALEAVVVEGPHAARVVLTRLVQRGALGTVLSAPAASEGSVGSYASEASEALDGLSGPTGLSSPLPSGASWLRQRVRSHRPAVDGLLDRLLSGVVAVSGGFGPAVDVAVERPDLVVVSQDGDRFSPLGWVVGAGAGTLVARAREAAAAAEDAGRDAMSAAGVLEDARTGADRARSAAADGARMIERAVHRRQVIEATRSRVESELGAVSEECADAMRHRQAIADALEQANDHLLELTQRLPGLQEAAAAAAARLEGADEARQHIEERRSHVAALRRDLEVQVAGLAERRSVLTNRLHDVERRLAGHTEARAQAEERRRRLEADLTAADRLGAVVEGHASHLRDMLDTLNDRRARQLDEVRAGGARLESLRRNRIETDARLNETRHELQRVELELAESKVRREAAEEAARRELGCSPEEAMGAPCPELPEGQEASTRAAEVDRELSSLGPVNPLALEELGALEERHRFLEEQVEDVRRARRELHQVIRAVDDEIMRVFAEAFADVNEHFRALVETLFPGGTGGLSLTEPEDLLDTGVEVEARPAGKNVRKLSLLSGGERSLVALAFLFAVFRSRPSPFYLLDEVEAALDDVNLHRFLDLLHEFREEAQLIIVSHQKRTMEAGDALYGVTMTPGGSSKVISQKVGSDPVGDRAVTASPA